MSPIQLCEETRIHNGSHLGMSSFRGRRLHFPLPSSRTEDSEAEETSRLVQEDAGEGSRGEDGRWVQGHLQAGSRRPTDDTNVSAVLRGRLLAECNRGHYQVSGGQISELSLSEKLITKKHNGRNNWKMKKPTKKKTFSVPETMGRRKDRRTKRTIWRKIRKWTKRNGLTAPETKLPINFLVSLRNTKRFVGWSQ